MQVTGGLMEGQVLQRDTRGRGGARIEGACQAVGTVEWRVLGADKALRGSPWREAGPAGNGTFRATVAGIPTGGPYRVELRVRRDRRNLERLAVRDVFVGDVWILAGQSNMEGVGNLAHASKPHPQVRAFYMRDEWAPAAERLHFLAEAVDAVHNGYGDGPNRPSAEELARVLGRQIKGVGPGLAFGLEMRRRTGVPQGLIACAHGGTSMAQWSPTLRDQGGRSLYGAMMRRFAKLGQPVAGVLWYQGESDAERAAAAVYTEKMIELVAATRRDMGLPKLPWFVVQLGCHACPAEGDAWNSIQDQQRRLPEVVPHLDVAPAVDLGLDDGIHIGGREQVVLGRRLARLADRLVHGNRKARPGIVMKGIRVVPTPHCGADSGCASVEIAYGNVAGRLTSEGRPSGFTLLDEQGVDTCAIYRTTLEGNRVLLHTSMPRLQLEPLTVGYGLGRFPYCNVADAEGMSLPAMRPVPVAPDPVLALRDWQTARLSGVSGLGRVGYGTAKAASEWQPAPPRAGFGVLPKPPADPAPGVFAMRTAVTAKTNLEALLLFGANAPFKLWLDGKAVLGDPKCGTPLHPEKYRKTVRLKQGAHELMVAIAIPGPAAFYGICALLGTPEGRGDPRLSV